METTRQEVIQKLRGGDEEVLKEVYLRFREPFISWLRSQSCEPEEAAELYQLTILIFYDNVVTGKLTELTSSLKTYLFAIGGNKLKELRREKSKTTHLIDHHLYGHINPPEELAARQAYEASLDQVADALRQLGEPCKTLLELVYYHQLSMEEISKKMGYKNANTTKNLKYKCLQRLQKIFQAGRDKTD